MCPLKHGSLDSPGAVQVCWASTGPLGSGGSVDQTGIVCPSELLVLLKEATHVSMEGQTGVQQR